MDVDDVTMPGEPAVFGQQPGMKPTNPKDAFGSNKVPLHLWPATATVAGSMALLDGAMKYGRGNYRAVGVRASIYFDACNRHLNAWFEGEDNDPDSGLPHLGHALACLAILVDAQAADQLTDDRQYPGGYRELLEQMTPHVERVRMQHAGRDPRHFVIDDAPNVKDSLTAGEELKAWVAGERRMDVIGPNGNEGLHYPGDE